MSTPQRKPKPQRRRSASSIVVEISGATLGEIAARLDISRSMLSRQLSGIHPPHPDLSEALTAEINPTTAAVVMDLMGEVVE